ncbi:MAG: methyltransferase domain-containing protein [Alphaproteobacteria bacterium]|nr:methyltransferase domain-containing protein [Alphaproteobacteria bacterium]
MQVFDRRTVRRHRDRAADSLAQHDFLLREVADRLSDRLLDINRRFPVALDLGCHTGQIGHAMDPRCGVDTLVQCDLSPNMARHAGGLCLAADEEAMPFAEGTFDLIVSNLSLHWVNDLPGALVQVEAALKPDGLFLAAMLGGGTLQELRACLIDAELSATGGASPRISPFADLRDTGALLQRAGFALPVVDSDRITVTYTDPFRLLADLRGMGESNATLERHRQFTRRNVLWNAMKLYLDRHTDEQNRISASFDIVYMHGWARHASQQTPLKPGSARTSLAGALGAREQSAGERALPGRPTKETS